MDLAFAKSVLEAEAGVVGGLVNVIDEKFLKACELLLECRKGNGHAVVTGMGKAGIIGEKMSATLASTGTSSISIHPVEAIHGDLGRIEPEDVVIIISNSGETDEIVALLGPLKETGSKIIAITESAESTLGKASDITLATGPISEACHLSMAPSCSTTAALALGDTLALSVSRAAGFTKRDFERFHPGGSLGKKRRYWRVADVMRTGDLAPSLPVTASVGAVIATISRAKAGACVLLDATGHIAGIFTDGDLRRLVLAGTPDLSNLPISEVMVKSPTVLGPDALAAEARGIMLKKKIGELPVVDDSGLLVGVVNLKDIPGDNFLEE
ncbi:MAG: KpsF/GutQ family sugar-phosphate isomerase [Planctomycetota bacterium]|jgi:arabinose-5-phosphate isomerase